MLDVCTGAPGEERGDKCLSGLSDTMVMEVLPTRGGFFVGHC